jgi:hypothetical protein
MLHTDTNRHNVSSKELSDLSTGPWPSMSASQEKYSAGIPSASCLTVQSGPPNAAKMGQEHKTQHALCCNHPYKWLLLSPPLQHEHIR